MDGERNYYLMCRLRTIYNIDKTYKIKKNPVTFNTYNQLRNDLQNVQTKVIKNFGFMITKHQEKENFIQFTVNI